MQRKKGKKIGNTFFGWITVSSKGQITLPREIQKTLGIESGERLLLVVRKNMDGVNLIRARALDAVFKKLHT